MPIQAHPRSRRRRCCSVPALKLGLAVYTILLLGCGCAVLGTASWSIATRILQVQLLDSPATYHAVTGMLVAAGAVSVVGGVVGCFAIAQEQRCALMAYILILVLVLALEGVAGILAHVYQEQLPGLLKESLPRTLTQRYMQNPDTARAVDALQTEFRCCGGLSFTEWRASPWYELQGGHRAVPDSCCKTVTIGCGARDHPSNIWYTGCSRGLSSSLGDHLLLLGALGCGLSLLQVLGLILACGLYLMLAKHT